MQGGRQRHHEHMGEAWQAHAAVQKHYAIQRQTGGDTGADLHHKAGHGSDEVRQNNSVCPTIFCRQSLGELDRMQSGAANTKDGEKHNKSMVSFKIVPIGVRTELGAKSTDETGDDEQ